MSSDRRGGPGRGRGPHAQDQQPRQGALPAHRHHQGRGPQLLRPDRAGAAAAPQGPRGDPDPLAARRRRTRASSRRTPRPARRPGCAPRRSRRPGRGRARGNGDHLVFPIVDDLATLTWLVNLAALELHVHQWTVNRNGQPRNPNRLVIDLDPGEPAGPAGVLRRSRSLVRDRLAERDLDARAGDQRQQGPAPVRRPAGQAEPRRDHRAGQGGGRGAPEGAPEAGHRHHDQGQAVGEGVPRLVAERRLQDDHLAVLPARPRTTPYVATPVTWDEVEAGAEDPLGLEQFRFEEVLERSTEHGDLFAS